MKISTEAYRHLDSVTESNKISTEAHGRLDSVIGSIKISRRSNPDVDSVIGKHKISTRIHGASKYYQKPINISIQFLIALKY